MGVESVVIAPFERGAPHHQRKDLVHSCCGLGRGSLGGKHVYGTVHASQGPFEKPPIPSGRFPHEDSTVTSRRGEGGHASKEEFLRCVQILGGEMKAFSLVTWFRRGERDHPADCGCETVRKRDSAPASIDGEGEGQFPKRGVLKAAKAFPVEGGVRGGMGPRMRNALSCAVSRLFWSTGRRVSAE